MQDNQIETILMYIKRQLDVFSILPPSEAIAPHHIEFCIKKMNFLYSKVSEKYFTNKKFELYDLNNSDKYAIFLYWLSYVLHKENNEVLATQIYLLNKQLHCIDLFYTRKMPDIFMLSHPIGSIFGDAKYQNFLLVLQNCTIGGGGIGLDVKYPVFDEGVVMHSNTQIIGNCKIGNNVIFGANTFILDTDIPSNSVVVGQYPNIKILKNKYNVIRDFFRGGK